MGSVQNRAGTFRIHSAVHGQGPGKVWTVSKDLESPWQDLRGIAEITLAPRGGAGKAQKVGQHQGWWKERQMDSEIPAHELDRARIQPDLPPRCPG